MRRLPPPPWASRALLAGLLLASSAHADAPPGATPEPSAPDVVTVSGARAEPGGLTRDQGVAGSVVTGERLRAPGATAAEILRTQPGVQVADTGGAGALSTASIRGATSAQTPVYLAGVRLNDDVGGTADLSLVPLWLVERVEVYRGHAPLAADRLGIGGAIFFDPRRPRGPEAALGGLAGSFGTRGAWARAGTGDADASVLVALRLDRATNDFTYRDDRGTRFDTSDDVTARRTNADVSTTDVWLLGSTRLGAGRADLVVEHVAREQGVPGLALLPTRAARATLRRDLAAMTATVPCADDDRCSVSTTSSALVTRSSYDDPLRELSLGATGLVTRGTRAEQSVAARIDASDVVTLSPAARVAVERLSIEPEGQASSGASRASRASRVSSRLAFATETRLPARIVVRALAAEECHGTSRGRAEACDDAATSGRVGVQWGGAPVAVLANAGRYVRVPTLGERFGVSGSVRGSEDLRSERGLTADAGVRGAADLGSRASAYGDLFVFAQASDDLVAYERSALGYVRPFNVGRARLLGLEARARVTPAPPLLVEVAATLLDPRDTTPGRAAGNDLLPFRSRLVLAPRVELGSRSLPVVSSARIEARYVHESSRYADPAGLVVVPAQGSLDVELEVRVLSSHLALRARLANLLDQARFDVIGYPLPGRAGFLSAEVSAP